MGALITFELELLSCMQRNLMGFYPAIVGIQETLDLVLIRKASKAALPAVLALHISTQPFIRTVWAPPRVLGVGHITQS